MTELKLGNKYECYNCGAKFYDLGKGEPICPKCGADQKEAEAKENPLVTQSVRRRRKAELLPDDTEGDQDEDVLPDDEDLDDEDLEIDEEELAGADLEDDEAEDEDEEEEDDDL